MTEEIGQIAVESPPSIIGEDGNFTENWTSHLKDESLHDNATLKTATSIDSLAGMTVSAQKMVGANKIAIPNEASTDVEWSDWHKAGGRPETARDYNFARPEALPEEHYNQELAAAAQELFHKLGLSSKQAQALFEFNNNNVISQLATNTQDADLAMTTLTEGLQVDWGDAFEQKKHLGNVAIEEATSTVSNGVKTVNQEFKDRLVQKAGNDPDIIRAFANLGSKFQETGSLKIDTVPTPGDIQLTIDEEIGKPVYGADYAKHGFTKEQHKAQVQKVAQLFREKTKHVKTGQ